jgi:hypothetical protein
VLGRVGVSAGDVSAGDVSAGDVSAGRSEYRGRVCWGRERTHVRRCALAVSACAWPCGIMT